MVTLPVRTQIEQKLDQLTEAQLDDVLRLIETVANEDDADYDEARDLTIGFIQGSTDAGQRAKAILRAEFGIKKDRDSAST